MIESKSMYKMTLEEFDKRLYNILEEFFNTIKQPLDILMVREAYKTDDCYITTFEPINEVNYKKLKKLIEVMEQFCNKSVKGEIYFNFELKKP